MLKIDRNFQSMFLPPTLFFTLSGRHPKSAAVLARLRSSFTKAECIVFPDEAAVAAAFQREFSPASAVCIFDADRAKRFSPTTRSRADNGIPSWSHGAQWGIGIGDHFDVSWETHYLNLENQLAAWFQEQFHERLKSGAFPWGVPRKGENVPDAAHFSDADLQVIGHLNNGPDLKHAIADLECAVELPADSRISWLRVPPRPIKGKRHTILDATSAFEGFELASSRLLSRRPHLAEEELSAGVELDPLLRDAYFFPAAKCFSVRRPDLHWTGRDVFASENDEMPGGFAELVHLDHCYGVNAEQWKQCFAWLCGQGPLLILVSHKWSKCYIPELQWLASHLQAQGYDVLLRTTDAMEDISIGEKDVRVANRPIGTIWRQFPIFETHGLLSKLVLAAHRGAVRMVPEFAHWGNKVWFSLFRKYAEWFEDVLPPDVFKLLNRLLPASHLVLSEYNFPCTVGTMELSSLEALRQLPNEERDKLVLKLCGANELTSRSYGVLMGHGLTESRWQGWINERLARRQPFIVQERVETGVFQLPVYHTKLRSPELFSCRVLLRPWMVGGELVSVSACAVPSNTLRVHGRVDMAVAPVQLE